MCITRIPVRRILAIAGTVLALGGCDEVDDILDPEPDPERKTKADVVVIEPEMSLVPRHSYGATTARA